MEWIRVSVYTSTFGIDAVCDLLMEEGISGFEIEDENEFNEFLENNTKYWDYVDEDLVESMKGETKVKFYIEANDQAPGLLAKVNAALCDLKERDADDELGRLTLDTDGIREEDWANNWKEFFKPVEVGEKILICPEWNTVEDSTDRIIFTVNPGMTFGTGTHASTKLCICELEKYVNENTNILDAGCGSGILSVIALMLGAKSAKAVDIDENCIHVAYENADRNGVDKSKYEVFAGDVTSDQELFKKLSETKYDVIVANIVADVIIALLPTVEKLIAKEGIFICSGIIKERLEDVLSAMKAQSIDVVGICEKDGWASVTCKF